MNPTHQIMLKLEMLEIVTPRHEYEEVKRIIIKLLAEGKFHEAQDEVDQLYERRIENVTV